MFVHTVSEWFSFECRKSYTYYVKQLTEILEEIFHPVRSKTNKVQLLYLVNTCFPILSPLQLICNYFEFCWFTFLGVLLWLARAVTLVLQQLIENGSIKSHNPIDVSTITSYCLNIMHIELFLKFVLFFCVEKLCYHTVLYSLNLLGFSFL